LGYNDAEPWSYPDSAVPFKHLVGTLSQWEVKISRVTVEENRLVLEFSGPDKLMKFVELLKLLGVTSNIEEREIRLKYDESFRLYLEKYRELHGRTVRDYMNYLKKLDGKPISYDFYLEISYNKWMIKTVQLLSGLPVQVGLDIVGGVSET